MKRRLFALTAMLALALVAGGTLAVADELDAPSIELGATGHGKQLVTVTAGASGAPDGFIVYWMPKSDFDANGGVWPEAMAGASLACFLNAPTLNDFDGVVSTFQLAGNQSAMVEIGDLFDEEGCATNDANELAYNTEYVFTAVAIGGAAFSPTVNGGTTGPQNCTYTQGYWKNHPEAWPTNMLTLGTVSYTQAQLLAIFGQPVQGNGLVSLAHQLIAAKLNILNGADPTAASATIAAADALIGSLVVPPIGSGSLPTNQTNSLTQVLDNYNNGVIGPGHCGSTPAEPSTWGKIKSIFHN